MKRAFSRAVFCPISNRVVLLKPTCLKSKPGPVQPTCVPCRDVRTRAIPRAVWPIGHL